MKKYIPSQKKIEKQAAFDAILRSMVRNNVKQKRYTLEEIAQKTGVTKERIRQIEDSAKKKFRQSFGAFLKSDGVTIGECLRDYREA